MVPIEILSTPFTLPAGEKITFVSTPDNQTLVSTPEGALSHGTVFKLSRPNYPNIEPGYYVINGIPIRVVDNTKPTL